MCIWNPHVIYKVHILGISNATQNHILNHFNFRVLIESKENKINIVGNGS